MVAWTIVFHLIGIVFWIGSLLTVTHVLALHTGEASFEARTALTRLETKLLRGLAHPAAAVVVITGILLLVQMPATLREHWLHLKLLLVVAVIVLDLRLTFRTRAFQAGRIDMKRRECTALHGMIAAAFLIIVVLVIIKPFA